MRNDSDQQWQRVAAFLRERADESIETHISIVTLVGEHAYKLKKPVSFDFLDFSTSALRRRACEREVQLNQRLAGAVYRGVVPITLQPGGVLSLGGDGEPIEWVVAMQRLPESRMLETLIKMGEVAAGDVERLADRLVDFYQTARRVEQAPAELSTRMMRLVQDNRGELLMSRHRRGLQPAGGLVAAERVCSRQLQFLALNGATLEARAAAGCVVDGHGDLRPEHVCMLMPPVVFDCLEFDDALRTVDVADDLSFFAMECERLGVGWIADQVWSVYRRRTGDRPPAELLAFYRSYRATVRAKVAALGGRYELARDYLQLADRALGMTSTPLAVIVRGVSGSGKSTVAAALASTIGARHLQTDQVRRQLFGASSRQLAYGEGHYRLADRRLVYDELLAQAATALRSGISVVVDGTFLSRAQTAAAGMALVAAGGRPFIVHCVCPEGVALARITARLQDPSRLSEATTAHFAAQRLLEEPSPACYASLTLDTMAVATQQQVAWLLDRLAAMLRTPPPAPDVARSGRACGEEVHHGAAEDEATNRSVHRPYRGADHRAQGYRHHR